MQYISHTFNGAQYDHSGFIVRIGLHKQTKAVYLKNGVQIFCEPIGWKWVSSRVLSGSSPQPRGCCDPDYNQEFTVTRNITVMFQLNLFKDVNECSGISD